MEALTDMVSGRISSCQLRSYRKRLCANSWNLDGIEQRAIQVVHNVVRRIKCSPVCSLVWLVCLR